jgi:hypothetical protein
MAVVIKKKEVQPVAKAQEALSQREQDALEAVGLAPEKPTESSLTVKVRDRKAHVFSEGDRVRITNDLYTWVEHWKLGDTGVVRKYHPAVPEANGDRRYACVIVVLDKPRKADRPEAYFHAWELEPITKEQQ